LLLLLLLLLSPSSTNTWINYLALALAMTSTTTPTVASIAASALRSPVVVDVRASSVSTEEQPPPSAITTTANAAASTATLSTMEEQLSADLALFLSNPSLRTALADGSLDLASYSQTLSKEVSELEDSCIRLYRQSAIDVQDALTKDLTQCETVLASLHEMLLGFQADLGGLSGDIRQLQEKSRLLDVQLRNRRECEHALRTYLQHIIISPALVETIQHGTINSTFIAAVRELQTLIRNASATQPQPWSKDMIPSSTRAAGTEIIPQLNTLRNIAMKRSREYLLGQLALLRRRPQTNVRMIQVHGLLKYAPLYDFLETTDHHFAQEIFNVYCESMAHTLFSLFRTYSMQILQLDSTATACTRNDTLVMDEATMRERAARWKAQPQQSQNTNTTVVCLGDRLQNIQNYETHPETILAHVALAQHQAYPYERLFQSILGHLVQAVTNEHVFCRQFFKRDAFQPLFHSTLNLLTEQLENYLFSCYDALCILLMIQVTHSFKRMAAQRKIHSLDPFFDQLTQLLWPRLKTVMEAHSRSIQNAVPEKLGTIDLHAHTISRRFAEFSCSILLILHSNHHQHQHHHKHSKSISSSTPATTNTTTTTPTTTQTAAGPPAHSETVGSTVFTVSKYSGGNKTLAEPTATISITGSTTASSHGMAAMVGPTAGEQLLADLAEMMTAFIVLLERLAEVHTVQKKRTVFLINNLDHILGIFQERRVTTGKECAQFAELLLKHRELFVEEELLSTGFSKLIAFVQQTEAYMATLQTSSSSNSNNNNNNTGAAAVVDYQVNTEVVESLVLEFASQWKSNIEQINRNVLSYFSNFRNGMEILKHCLTQLLLYYTRFQDIIRKVWRGKPSPAFAKDLVSTTVILAEIKKYALAI
jgi:hypothetical protein